MAAEWPRTALSVNVNKIAVLRNSRGGALPDVVAAARACLDAGAHGITVHPRPDARHVRAADVDALARLTRTRGVELNLEGNPFAPPRAGYPGFLALCEHARPAQATLVPDGDAQLTSDHGFDFARDADALRPLVAALHALGCRVSLFANADAGASVAHAAHAGADRIVRAMGLDPAQLARFRYRGHGWPGTARADLADGTHGEMSYADSWGGHLSKEVQFRCKICPDAVGGVADVAVADAWYEDASGSPSFAEQDGRSLVMARTPAGVAALAAARAAGAIVTAPLPVGEIVRMQGSQANRKRLVIPRLAACALLFQPRPDVRGLATGAAMRRGTLGTALRNLVGTARRIILGRR